MTINTILALHGFTGSGKDWDDLAETVSPEYTIIAPDIIGHGDALPSENVADYHMEQVAPALLSDVTARIHLLGYSMGGRLALYMATRYPEKIATLTLVSASPGLKTQAKREARRQSDNALADKIEEHGIDWFVKFWDSLSLWDNYTDKLRLSVNQRRRQNEPEGLANSLRGMGTGAMPSLWDQLPMLPMPVHLIVGELDMKFVQINREMVNLIPNAVLTAIGGVGHTVHLEAPEMFQESLLTWIGSSQS